MCLGNSTQMKRENIERNLSVLHMLVVWSITLADRTLRGPTCYRSCGMTSRTHWKWGGWKKYWAWASPWSLMVPDFFSPFALSGNLLLCWHPRAKHKLSFYFEYWWKGKSESMTTNRRNIMKVPLLVFLNFPLTQDARYYKEDDSKIWYLNQGFNGSKNGQNKLFSTWFYG